MIDQALTLVPDRMHAVRGGRFPGGLCRPDVPVTPRLAPVA